VSKVVTRADSFVLVLFADAVYKKHYPPALNDDVWRLDKIGKDGAFHKRLNQAGLWTVEHFLRLVVMDPQRLRNVSLSTTLEDIVTVNTGVSSGWT
jgi:hypothetical protein